MLIYVFSEKKNATLYTIDSETFVQKSVHFLAHKW